MSLHPWGVVLDADVHLRSSARDLFLYLGAMGVIDPLWSEQILEEVARNFPTGREKFRTLRRSLESAYPEALKGSFEHRIAQLALTREKDRHVLALAGEYEADLISFNHRDFDPTEASHFRVHVLHPDEALTLLIRERRLDVERAARRAYLKLRRPPVRWADYIAHLRADEMPAVATWLATVPEPLRASS